MKFTPHEAKDFIVKGPIPNPHVYTPPIEYNCGDFYPEFENILIGDEIIKKSAGNTFRVKTGIHDLTIDGERLKEYILWLLTAHYQLSVHELQESTPELLVALASGLRPINKDDVDYFLTAGKAHRDILFSDIFKTSIAAQNIFFNLKQDEIGPAIETYLKRLVRGLKARSA